MDKQRAKSLDSPTDITFVWPLLVFNDESRTSVSHIFQPCLLPSFSLLFPDGLQSERLRVTTSLSEHRLLYR